jgi:hypothetical protein
MGYRLYDRGSIPGRGKRFFPTPQRPDRLWGPPFGIEWVTEDRPGREPTPTSICAEVKNGGAIPLLAHTSSWRGA